MAARAHATQQTGQRILDAAAEVFWQAPTASVPLEEVAKRAGVSVRTILRRFGSREGLMAAAGEREVARRTQERAGTLPGDIDAAVKVLLDHYEADGDRVLNLLAAQAVEPALTPMVQMGRTVHRDWCANVFAPAISHRQPADRERLLAQLVAVSDVSTWKLLRRDAGLSRAQVHLSLVEILTFLCKE